MKRLALFCGLMLLAFQATADQDYLYILSAKAKIMAKPTFSAKAIDQASKGEKVENLDSKNNRWFKVRYNGKEGWVSRLSVSPNPPMRRMKRLVLNDENLQNNARRRASSVSTTAAVRGLRGDDRNRLGSYENATDYQALAKIEGMEISENDVETFAQSKTK